MTDDIKLDANHDHWMMTFYKCFVVADHSTENLLTMMEREERIR